MAASSTPTRTGFQPIEVTPGRTTAPIVREVDFSAASTEPVVPIAVAEPPRSGSGSTREAWATYANQTGVPVSDDATRDDVIAAVDATHRTEES